MFASLRALLHGIIDYAGLFPPAALPLDQAIRNYARYRQEPESWMLARFICPACQLSELSPFVKELIDPRSPFYFSSLGRGGKTNEEFSAGWPQDFRAIRGFRDQHAEQVRGDVYETRLPPTFRGIPECTPSSWEEKVTRNEDRKTLLVMQDADLTTFFEVTPTPDLQAAVSPLIETLADEKLLGWLERVKLPRPGFKLRCGGLDAAAFPSCELVAFVIAACRDAKVPLKFTAGLHHPLRHYNAGVQTHMHGFLNVFVAGVLAQARGLSAEQLRPIIEDEDARNFAFDDAGLRWKALHATTDEITAARRMVTSFGSCSFDEPRDDLRALGWLP